METPVQEFLASRRIALVGFSRNPRDFSRMLDAPFRARGYEVVPPSLAETVGRDCLDAGVRRIWPHRFHGWFRTRGRAPSR
jgi:predicted CoA-binding protein